MQQWSENNNKYHVISKRKRHYFRATTQNNSEKWGGGESEFHDKLLLIWLAEWHNEINAVQSKSIFIGDQQPPTIIATTQTHSVSLDVRLNLSRNSMYIYKSLSFELCKLIRRFFFTFQILYIKSSGIFYPLLFSIKSTVLYVLCSCLYIFHEFNLMQNQLQPFIFIHSLLFTSAKRRREKEHTHTHNHSYSGNLPKIHIHLRCSFRG